MDKRSLIVVMLSGLGGCNLLDSQFDNGVECNTLHEVTRETVTESGVLIKPTADSYLSPERIETIYKETQSCVGVYAVGPVVEFRSFSRAGLGGAWAVYMPVHLTVLINADETSLDYRDCETDEQAIRHEFVHHLLYVSGQDHRDGQPIFSKCGLGVSTNN